MQGIAETFLQKIKERNINTKPYIEKLFNQCYEDIQQSVLAYNLSMPSYDTVKNKFYETIDKEYYSIDIVNSNTEIEILLNEDTGELNLTTPFSIFVGGQVLDRGVTIPNMIGFYYGRSPKVMQQDTVLQHSRMFGYRKNLLPVTRFYTTERIHSNMEKITEIDSALREDIENGRQGNGVYFITHKDQNSIYDKGGIKPCSPEKIKASDIILLRAHKRILPVGFTPVNKAQYLKINREIDNILNPLSENQNYFKVNIQIDMAEKLLTLAYKTIKKDDESKRFITCEEIITTLKYMMSKEKNLTLVVKRNKNSSKFRKTRLQDSPETGEKELSKAKESAINTPSIILLQENGNSEGWHFRPFWWPILVSPKNVPKTIFASKIAGEPVKRKTDTLVNN